MDILIPEVGESVREALLGQWFKKNGETVAKDDPICELETDKITLDLHADSDGILTILAEAGTTLPIGSKIGIITENSALNSNAGDVAQSANVSSLHQTVVGDVASSPSIRQALRENRIDPATITPTGKDGRITLDDLFSRIEEKTRTHVPVAEADSEHTRKMDIDTLFNAISPAPTPPQAPHQTVFTATTAQPEPDRSLFVPTNEQITCPAVHSEAPPVYNAHREERVNISPIRKRISERLVAARQQTAMLTTFNEADLDRVVELRKRFKKQFIENHGTPLGLMPFFVKACCQALRQFPLLNARIDGDQIVYHHFYDIGIAIGAEKGLVVPVVRDADKLRLFEIDSAIAGFGEKIRSHQLSISDLEGGTFTISNGGVYGSMLSTPILNPPQSGVLGMHAIQERPVVRDGQIVIAQMMYLALSYDHRIVDGRDAVGFLKKIKECIEDPEKLFMEG